MSLSSFLENMSSSATQEGGILNEMKKKSVEIGTVFIRITISKECNESWNELLTIVLDFIEYKLSFGTNFKMTMIFEKQKGIQKMNS